MTKKNYKGDWKDEQLLNWDKWDDSKDCGDEGD